LRRFILIYSRRFFIRSRPWLRTLVYFFFHMGLVADLERSVGPDLPMQLFQKEKGGIGCGSPLAYSRGYLTAQLGADISCREDAG
jgi:hypothetical protein